MGEGLVKKALQLNLQVINFSLSLVYFRQVHNGYPYQSLLAILCGIALGLVSSWDTLHTCSKRFTELREALKKVGLRELSDTSVEYAVEVDRESRLCESALQTLKYLAGFCSFGIAFAVVRLVFILAFCKSGAWTENVWNGEAGCVVFNYTEFVAFDNDTAL